MKILALLLAVACISLSGRPLRVFVSIGPQLEGVRRIGGDRVSVEAMLPAGSNPETYSAGPRKLSALGRADLFVKIGVPFEKVLMKKIVKSFQHLRVLDGTQGMEIRMMEESEEEETSHGALETGGKSIENAGQTGTVQSTESGHHHHGPDPHVWLSIGNMIIHARLVADTLCGMDPAHAREYQRRCGEYVRELEQLDRELRLSLARYHGRQVVVFHPAFGYFLNRYGLTQRAVELGGKEPGGRHLGELMRRAMSDGIRSIYVQPQFNRKASEVIAREIGGRVRVLNPLPEEYSKGMLELCRRLVQGFEQAQD